MKDLLFVKRLYLSVFASEKPDSKSDEEWEFKDKQVFGYIRQWVEDNVVNHIANETYARALWYKLETLYDSKIGNNKLFLPKQAMNLRYKEGSSILDHLNEFQGCFDQLSNMCVKCDEDIQGLWFLNALPDSWKNLCISLKTFAPNGIVTMEYVKSGVLNEKVRRKTQGSSSSHSKVIVTENRERSKSKGQRQNGRGNFGTVKMGNDGLAKVIGIEDVCLLDDEGYCNTYSDG
ncbi:hypothetical protein Patl1_37274 [Pistacia atlantica]|nr:hypothetical protein Patl1_37274 [Pistacia atlantica]